MMWEFVCVWKGFHLACCQGGKKVNSPVELLLNLRQRTTQYTYRCINKICRHMLLCICSRFRWRQCFKIFKLTFSLCFPDRCLSTFQRELEQDIFVGCSSAMALFMLRASSKFELWLLSSPPCKSCHYSEGVRKDGGDDFASRALSDAALFFWHLSKAIFFPSLPLIRAYPPQEKRPCTVSAPQSKLHFIEPNRRWGAYLSCTSFHTLREHRL